MHRTEKIIDEIVKSACNGGDNRFHYLMRESLRNLVRLAKSEQLLEIRQTSARLTRLSGKRASPTRLSSERGFPYKLEAGR